eukprot:TRINITY_DN4066_c0_g1_i3.p1 TRINITY_DN4066_c0_g1~~TRINITY_DN4066_c0_g1_i3.p1  ORF type:complete len:335 (-),score=37.10 TRINITY_DN4066_c0_g1_i3:10-993(-)
MLMETASAPRTPPHEESDTESEGEQDQRKDRSTPRKHHHQHHQHHPQKEQQQLVRQQQEMQYEAQEPLTGNSFTLEPQHDGLYRKITTKTWERRNSIQYQKNIIPVCHHLEEDMLYFPLEVIRTFFGQHTYDVVTSAEYWCNEHMRRCNDTSIFADLCTTSRGLINGEGFKHLSAMLAMHNDPKIREQANRVRELFDLVKSIEEKRSLPIFKVPEGQHARVLSLQVLFSGTTDSQPTDVVKASTYMHSFDVAQDSLRAPQATTPIAAISSGIMYQCECGETFNSSQSKAGHSHFCKVHQEMKKKKMTLIKVFFSRFTFESHKTEHWA